MSRSSSLHFLFRGVVCESTSSPARSCENSSKLPFPVFCSPDNDSAQGCSKVPILLLLLQLEHQRKTTATDTEKPQLWFPPSSSEDDKHLCCEVKIQNFLIFEEHLEHFMSVLSNGPFQSHCSQLELRKWNCSVSPGEHLNIYIRSLTATMLENVPFPPEVKKTNKEYLIVHTQREETMRRKTAGPGPASRSVRMCQNL